MVYAPFYNCDIIADGVYTKTQSEDKPCCFRYEVHPTTLEENSIDIPKENIVTVREYYPMTPELNRKAAGFRKTALDDDSEYYSSRLAAGARGTQTSMTTGHQAPFAAPAVVTQSRPPKKKLFLVPTDIDSYLSN